MHGRQPIAASRSVHSVFGWVSCLQTRLEGESPSRWAPTFSNPLASPPRVMNAQAAI